MDDAELLRRLRTLYSPLIDPEDGDAGAEHHEPTRLSLPDMRRTLRRVYLHRPGVDRVALRVGGVRIGVTTRDRVCRDAGTAGGEGLGDGDRASVVGDSTQYRLIRFACERCRRAAATVFYDERRVPSCDEHGPMELLR